MKILTLLFFIIAFSLASFGQCKQNAGQRAAFAKLPASEKVALWKAHLEKQLDKRKLNGVQRGLILTGLGFLSEEFYREAAKEMFQETELGKAVEKWKAELRANFSLKEGSEIFEQLDYKGEESFAPSDCDCSTTWTFCDSPMTCQTGCIGCSCSQIINCGPFYAWRCNGRCKIAPEY